MIKTILVPLRGQESDMIGLEAAVTAARLLNAHIECLHVREKGAREAWDALGWDLELYVSAVEMFDTFQAEEGARAAAARSAFDTFVALENLPVAGTAADARQPSIAWRERSGDAGRLVAAEARFHDLVISARETGKGSAERLGHVLLDCGRPLLVADRAPKSLSGTVAIAWKSNAGTARAVTAAMPVLERARRVLVIAAEEGVEPAAQCLTCAETLAEQLRWHGLRAEPRYVVPGGRSVGRTVTDTARDCDADLLVTGAYGHSRVREFVFGGFTREMLAGAALPVLMFH